METKLHQTQAFKTGNRVSFNLLGRNRNGVIVDLFKGRVDGCFAYIVKPDGVNFEITRLRDELELLPDLSIKKLQNQPTMSEMKCDSDDFEIGFPAGNGKCRKCGLYHENHNDSSGEGEQPPMKHTPGPWSSSPQQGTPGHCFAAQVWGPDGKSLAVIEPTEDEREASANARIQAAAPEMVELLEDLIDHVWLPNTTHDRIENAKS